MQAAGRLTNGQIILMHDGIQNTVTAISQIMANLNSRNLCPGMISPTTGRAVAPDGGSPAADHTARRRLHRDDGGRHRVRRPLQHHRQRHRHNNWIVTVTITPPQQISTTWNASVSWDSSGNVMTARPNGSGNSFGFTTMFNGNSSARPSVSCRVG